MFFFLLPLLSPIPLVEICLTFLILLCFQNWRQHPNIIRRNTELLLHIIWYACGAHCTTLKCSWSLGKILPMLALEKNSWRLFIIGQYREKQWCNYGIIWLGFKAIQQLFIPMTDKRGLKHKEIKVLKMLEEVKLMISAFDKLWKLRVVAQYELKIETTTSKRLQSKKH